MTDHRAADQPCEPGCGWLLAMVLVTVFGIGALGSWAWQGPLGSVVCARSPRLLRRHRPAATPSPVDEPAGADLVGETNVPGHLVLAERDGVPVGVDVAAVGGLGITGPGAEEVLRAAMYRQLMATDGQSVEFWTYRDLAGRLLPDVDVDTLPGVLAVDTPEELARRLEVENVHRTRLTDDVVDPAEDAACGEQLPLLVVLAGEAAVTELSAPIRAGRDLKVTALIAGPWPYGPTCRTSTDGLVTDLVGDAGEHLEEARLRVLAREDAAQFAPLLPHGAVPAPDTRADDEQPADETGEPAKTTTLGPLTDEQQVTAKAAEDPVADELMPQDETRPVELRVLGPITITAGGTELVTGLRRDSRDLLAYLTLQPDGARSEQIYADLWPAADPIADAEKLRSAIRAVRTTLRTATGARHAMYIIHTAGRYRLDTAQIGVDLSRFQTAVATATNAGTEHRRRAWLEHAAALYAGEPFTGRDYLFAEEIREAERRRILTVLTRLADITEADNPELAIDHLERACDLDPFNSHLYDRIITIHQRLGHLDAAERTLRLRDTRMADLETAD